MSIKMDLVLEYSSLFEYECENIQDLLRGVSKEVVYKCAAHHIMKHLFQEDQFNAIDSLNNWFSESNSNYKTEILKKVNSVYSDKLDNLSFIHPLSHIKIVQYSLNVNGDDIIELSNDDQEINIFKIYLLINEEVANQFKKNNNYFGQEFNGIEPEVAIFSIGMKMSELFHYNFESEFYCQMVKFSIFNSFIKSKSELKTHLINFLKKYNVNSIDEYIGKLIQFIPHIINSNKHGFIEFSNSLEEEKGFLENISNDKITIENDFDFISVRDSPLIKLNEEKYLIIHPLFLLDKIFKSIYFDFNNINKNLFKLKESKISDFRSYYTTNFSEKYLLNEVLKYSLKNKYLQISNEKLNGVESAPDYYIREGNKVILIENKDTYFSAKVKDSDDFNEVMAELRKKLVVKDSGKKSAIKQLVNNIIQVFDYKNNFDKNYKLNNLKIYPIIIVHDIFFNCPGLNKIVLKWFNDELSNSKTLIQPEHLKNIMPVLIINIDSIIRSAEILRTNNMNIFNLLNLCIDKMNQNDRTSRKKIESGMLPTSLIIENHINARFRTLVKHNKILDIAFSL